MAAISSIRKHGVFLICIIGVALLAFLLGDFNQLTSLFSNKNTMIKINGKKLDKEYQISFEQNSALWRNFYQKTSLEESETYQIHEMTWQNMLDEKMLDQQLASLGLSFTPEMVETARENMIASLSTQNPHPLLGRFVQGFIERGASVEDVVGLISSIDDHASDPNYAEFYSIYKAIERMDIIDQKRNILNTMAMAATKFSTPLANQFAANNKSAMVSFCSLNPNMPAFKDVKPAPTEAELKTWFEDHSSKYLVKNDARDIDVAVLSILPSTEDKKTIEDSVNAQFERFTNATSLVQFNLDNGYDPMDSVYFKKEDIQLDTLASAFFNSPVGTNIAPINYEDMIWYYGKAYNVAYRPDSVLVAFLVIDYKTDRNPNSTRTKKQARAERDSLENILKTGQANIFQLTPQYLGGRNATDTTVWYSERGTTQDLYNDLLATPQYGLYNDDVPSAFVIYQVLGATAPIEKRQIVFYGTEIVASDATIKNLRSQANSIMSSSSNANELLDNSNKAGVQVFNGVDVTSMSATIAQLQNCREIVSWAFNAETEKDAVSDVFQIDNGTKFAVAAVRNIKEKGMPKFADVKDLVEADCIAAQKIEMIEKMVNDEITKGSSMQSIASKYQTAVADSITLVWGGDVYQNRNIENAAIGKIFSLPINKTSAVSATNFVYVVSVDNFKDAAPASKDLAMEKMMLTNVLMGRNRSASNVILQNLKDNAEVLDQRMLFYAR